MIELTITDGNEKEEEEGMLIKVQLFGKILEIPVMNIEVKASEREATQLFSILRDDITGFFIRKAGSDFARKIG